MITLLLVAILATDRVYENITKLEVISVYDGDTITVTIPEYPALIGERIKVRIAGIDTAELTSKDQPSKELARAAKQAVVTMVRSGQPVTLRNVRREKYFRILADVYVGEQNVAAELLKRSLAKPYNGGKKPLWP